MKKIFLYGAGRRGKKVAEFLNDKGIEIAGFLDSYKSGEMILGEHRYQIFSPESIPYDKNDIQVIISIAEYSIAREIKEKMKDTKIITVEEVLSNHFGNIMERNRNYIAEYHDREMEDYYREAESKDQLQIFWNERSEFYKLFSLLNLSNVIELACGHGRHVKQYIDRAEHITLVDILDKNISFCKERFIGEQKIDYYMNNGHDLKKLGSNVYSALFTYDAMVHFELMDIFEYLRETERVLQPGGLALFHHSNNTDDYRITFSTGTSGRNYMSAQLFAYLANRAGLNVKDQRLINWNGVNNLDCLTLVEKLG